MVARLGTDAPLEVPADDYTGGVTPDKSFMTVPITKWENDETNKGVYVYGMCTNDTLDLDDQIIDRDFARDALNKWFEDWANVRQQHSVHLPPAGKAVLLEEKPEGFFIKTHVVEPTAVELVKEGVYQAYSIGISKPRIVRDIKARGGRVVGGIVSENSLVDFPANPTCKFVMAKRASGGAVEDIEKVFGNPEEILAKRRNNRPAPIAAKDDLVEPDLEKTTITAPNPGDVKEGEGDGDDGVDLDWDDSLAEPPKGEGAEGESTSVSQMDKGFQFGQNAQQTQGQPAAPPPPPNMPHPQGQAQPNAQQPPAPAAAQPQIDPQTGQPIDPNAPPAPAAPAPAAAPTAPDHAAIAQTAAVAGAVAGAVHAHVAGQQGGTAPGAPAPEAKPAAPAPPGAAPAKDTPPPAQKSATEASYAEHRLHDALCAAYSRKSVNRVHPLLAKEGIAAAIDPTVVHKALSEAINADGGSGRLIGEILELQNQFTAATVLKNSPAEVVDAAREDLHKVFTDDYPDTKKPTPTNMSPGAFRRPYISGGTAPLAAPGMDSAMPTVPADADAPEPGDFTRGPITEGRQDDAPESTDAAPKPTPGKPGRVYYTNAARDQANAAMRSLHDHIAGVFPDLCPMGSSGAGAVGSNDGQHGADQPFDNRANSQPKTQSSSIPEGQMPGWKGAGEPEITKAVTDDGESVEGAEVDVPEQTAKLSKKQRRALVTELTKRFVSEPELVKVVADVVREDIDVTDVVQSSVEAATADLQKRLSSALERIEELESQPDPAQAPMRGSVVFNRALEKSATEAPTFEERREAAQNEEIEALVRYANHSPSPELRERARAQLTKMYGTATIPGLTD